MRAILALALATAAALPAPAPAQYAAQPPSDADRLGSVMRRVAAAPTDVGALVEAGELSVKLDDMSGAAALFARAERVDPRNARVKAGMAAILVRAERPAEALRYFQQAETLGLPPARYAADRGLAYDLLGEQERAQRDYRVALRGGPDDETARRYALSLGIAGKREAALQQLDPLVRRQDRGAWRARAFVLAMTGDVAGAEKIATTMMPGGMAAGLQPFFQRLPALSPADRAFAVHFGEVSPTPERLADARLKPALPPLGPDPTAPVQVAAAQPLPVAVAPARPAREERRRPRRDERAAATRIAVGRTPITPAAAPTPTPAPVQVAAAPAPAPRPTPAPVQVATVAPRPTVVPTPAPVQVAAVAPRPEPAPVTAATAPPPAPAPPTSAPAPVQVAAVAPAPVPEAPAPGFTSVAETAPTPAVRSEESILARIVASLTIPGAELGVAEPPRRRPEPAAVATLAAGEREASREEADREAAARTIAAAREARPEPVKPEPRTPRRPAPKEVAAADEPTPRATRRGGKAAEETAPRKPEDAPAKPGRRGAREVAEADDAKAPVTRKGRQAAAPETKKAKPAPKPEPKEPERIWVQVAGGANEGDLPKAWRAVQGKSATLKGRAAYATPLRATNRVVTGPFKTDAEARAFVNRLAKEGVSAFPFTSSAGQKLTKLPAQ
jgi:tetratricopeptide (TPR) repeat protein